MEHRSLKSLLEVVTGFGQADRRSEIRLPAHGLASIRWWEDGDSRYSVVSLLGVSEHGISFRITRPLAVGQKIIVEPQEQVRECFEPFEAVVRHVQLTGEFIVGAEAVSRIEQSAASTEGEMVEER